VVGQNNVTRTQYSDVPLMVLMFVPDDQWSFLKCDIVTTESSNVAELIVLIFVPDTRVACFVARAVVTAVVVPANCPTCTLSGRVGCYVNNLETHHPL
jgi:hypothetical protein